MLLSHMQLLQFLVQGSLFLDLRSALSQLCMPSRLHFRAPSRIQQDVSWVSHQYDSPPHLNEITIIF